MIRSEEAIERGISLYLELVLEREALRAEYVASGRDFRNGPPTEEAERALAERRHLEWFLMERPSEVLAGVPAQMLRERWKARADAALLDWEEAMRGSFAGVFEVTGSTPGSGAWVTDLFGAGAYPLEEPEASMEMRVGDLLVGRLFPIGEGAYRASPASALFRDERLLAAMRRDLAQLRGSRRGVLRIEQIELERLFFPGPAAEGAEPAPLDVGAVRRIARRALLGAGIGPEILDLVLDEVTRAARAGDGDLARVLNALAFEDGVDLAEAQRVLSELWATERAAVSEPEATTGPEVGEEPPASEAAPDTDEVREALERFDRGRASGGDLEALYDQLSQDLGLDEGAEDEREITLPDFPGVVGAMVEEFLWEVGREEGPEAVEALACLRKLSAFAEGIGVFEDLGARQLLDFAGRWVLDEGVLGRPEEARVLAHALERFTAWCEDSQSHPLRSACAPFLDTLGDSLARMVALREACARGARVARPFEVLEVPGVPGDVPSREPAEAEHAGDELLLRDDAGGEHRARLEGAGARLVRPGDILHGVLVGGRLELVRCYPPELRGLLGRAR